MGRRHHRHRALSLLVAALLTAVAGCTTAGTTAGTPQAVSQPTGTSTTSSSMSDPAVSLTPTTTAPPLTNTATPEQEATYGTPAQTEGVDYQPDVVVVGGGAAAIRSADDTGLIWTIDRAAPGADQLEVGKVLLLTSVAAGRVAALTDTDDSRIVTLAPVELTEVIRNGDIDLEQPVDPTALRYQEIPALPWMMSEPTAEDLPPRLRNSGGAFAAAGLPLSTSESISVPVGDWTVKPYAQANKLGVNLERKAGGGLKASVDFAFSTSNLSIHGLNKISNGTSTASGVTITGITGLTVSVAAGVKNGSADNSKLKIEVPIELNIPIPSSPLTGGLPMNLKISFKLVVSTALTGNNSTLLGTGKYKLDGPIGIDNGTVLTPTFSVEQSIIDSLSGITLGPSGIVVAVSMKFQLGLGTPALTAGPFVSITTSLGMTNGSALGSALATCKGATLDVDLGGGASVTLSASAADLLAALLPKGTKLSLGVETKTNVLHREQIVPDVPLCHES